ncbi:hypothetical protein M885DRAFT_487336 [Pelagophyceae sp. CCMP2097]|nr:hypothetical protein M885DRAFT_487336 [Pelagophyceae sp. CCMP2097]
MGRPEARGALAAPRTPGGRLQALDAPPAPTFQVDWNDGTPAAIDRTAPQLDLADWLRRTQSAAARLTGIAKKLDAPKPQPQRRLTAIGPISSVPDARAESAASPGNRRGGGALDDALGGSPAKTPCSTSPVSQELHSWFDAGNVDKGQIFGAEHRAEPDRAEPKRARPLQPAQLLEPPAPEPEPLAAELTAALTAVLTQPQAAPAAPPWDGSTSRRGSGAGASLSAFTSRRGSGAGASLATFAARRGSGASSSLATFAARRGSDAAASLQALSRRGSGAAASLQALSRRGSGAGTSLATFTQRGSAATSRRGSGAGASLQSFMPGQNPREKPATTPLGKAERRENYFDMVRDAWRSQQQLHFNAADGELDAKRAARGVAPCAGYARRLLASRQAKGTLPWPVLLRTGDAGVLDLNGHGLGDDVIDSLALALDGLDVDTLKLASNRLTDFSLERLFVVLAQSSTVTYLDVSGNDVDDSARVLRDYLASPRCALTTLQLKGADIDDDECAKLMTAVKVNNSLTVLNISDNHIGAAESRNIVEPGFVTGGEAIALALEANSTLLHLSVSWNQLTKESARAIALSLGVNKTLTRLDLAMNGFGGGLRNSGGDDEPAQWIAVALQSNSALTYLDLAYNSVSSSAALCIANALSVNQTLTTLILDGNPIGRRAAEALVTALRRCQTRDRRLEISMENADVETVVDSLFDVSKPAGRYTLDLATPYGSLVANELYRMAETKVGCHFVDLSVCEGRKSFKAVSLARAKDTEECEQPWLEPCRKLVKAMKLGGCSDKALTHLFHSMDLEPDPDFVRAIAAALEGVSIDGDETMVIDRCFGALFRHIDFNGSGTLDLAEMQNAFTSLGRKASAAQAQRAINAYDVDNSGMLEVEEFVAFLSVEFLPAPVRLPLGRLVDAATGARWRMPQKGLLRATFAAEPRAGGLELQCSDLGHEGYLRLLDAAVPEARAKLFDLAVSNTDLFFSLRQAQQLVDRNASGRGPLATIAMCLRVMSSREDAARFVETNLSLEDRVRLRETMGPALFDATCGNATGHYELTLDDDRDRATLASLAQIDGDEFAAAHKLAGSSDTSQHGNGHNFRNEWCDREPIVLDAAWLAANAKRRKVAFDFVTTARPRRGDRPISEKRFVATLAGIPGVVESGNKHGSTKGMYFTPRMGRQAYAFVVAHARKVSYNPDVVRLADPYVHDGAEASGENAAWAAAWDAGPGADGPLQAAAEGLVRAASARRMSLAPAPKKGTGVPAWALFHYTRHWREWRDSSFGRRDWMKNQRKNDDDDDEPPADGRAPPSNQERPESYACFDVVFQKLTLAEREATAPPTYKAVNYALALVRVAFMSVWLTAEMCVRVVALFPAADYARVECAHLLHARCYDLDRFYVILEMLETAERVELVHRLGWLNVANPVKPDVRGGYGLDLRYHDHRALVKVLVRLAAKEPGRNWQHVEFRYRDGQGSPGWTLPANWDLNDPGPRMNGFLLLTYSCEPKDGCAANFEVRNKLQQRFLCGRPLG